MNEVEELPPFDPKAKCIKCGWSIPDPVAPAPKFVSTGPAAPPASAPAKPKPKPAAAAADPPKPAGGPPPPGGILHQEPPPPPQPPTVFYCNGLECPWDEDGDGMTEHMHQICDTCGFEWLSKPLA